MDSEKVNLAIAKSLGVICCDQWIPASHPLMGVEKNCSHEKCHPRHYFPPKYDQDSNLMFDVIETIWGDKELSANYCMELDKLVCPEIEYTYDIHMSLGYTGWIAHVSPDKQAKAYLIAKGLYEKEN